MPAPVCFPPDLSPGAAVLTYRPGTPTCCPGCGQSQWLVGRIMAECACCETALSIDLSYRGWSGLTAPTNRSGMARLRNA